MNVQEIISFAKTALQEYDAIENALQDAAFREKLAAFIAGVQGLLGTGVVQYLIGFFTAQIKKLQAKIAELTTKKEQK